MIADERRHRLLGGRSRASLIAALRSAGRPLGVRDLATLVGLHPNSVREQLALLVDAGLVARTSSAPAGRGRPSLRYAMAPEDGGSPADADRALATALVDQLSRSPGAAAAADAAGRRWGASLAARDPSPAAGGPGDRATAPCGGDAASERLHEILDLLGFAPERPSGPGEPVRLRHCPFDSLARFSPTVVCGIHLGLMRGVLRELGSPTDVVALEPFAAPGVCLAHLGARAGGSP